MPEVDTKNPEVISGELDKGILEETPEEICKEFSGKIFERVTECILGGILEPIIPENP